MKFNFLKSSFIAAVIFVGVGTALASITVDPETGEGFVGKGEVQRAFGWNNQALQQNANALEFRVLSVTETTWECLNTNNDRIQDRNRTTATQRVLDSVARERNQITGFILEGYEGEPTTSTEGPQVGSCPSGPWQFVAGSVETVPVTQRVEASLDGTNWILL